MKPLSYLALIVLTLTSLASGTFLLDWTIGNDYEVRFSGTGAVGTFRGLEGTIQFAPDNLSNSYMDVRVAVQTIDTGNKTKDSHARGDGWFDAEKYPYIRFVSTRFQQQPKGYLVEGELTLHGVTKSVRIPFTFDDSKVGKVFAGQFVVNRQDYGIEGPWLAALTVSDELTVDLRVPVKAN